LEIDDALDPIAPFVSVRPAPEPVEVDIQTRRHLAVVDRSALRRDCLKLALGQPPRRWRVTDFESAAELQASRQGAPYSVILLSAATSWQIDFGELAQLIGAAGHTPVLVTAECDDPDRARLILRSGARGFLPMSYGLKVLVAALERVRTGGTFVPLMLSEADGSAGAGEAGPAPERLLTRRQRDVLALISEGKSNKLIADALGMSESTVKAHVKQIIRRLNVVNRTQAALLATRSRPPAGARPVPMSEGVLSAYGPAE
jgi:DNA-binding NarL/FixJ family response regulator